VYISSTPTRYTTARKCAPSTSASQLSSPVPVLEERVGGGGGGGFVSGRGIGLTLNTLAVTVTAVHKIKNKIGWVRTSNVL